MHYCALPDIQILAQNSVIAINSQEKKNKKKQRIPVLSGILSILQRKLIPKRRTAPTKWQSFIVISIVHNWCIPWRLADL